MVFNKKIKFSFYSIYLNQLMCKIGRDEREKKIKVCGHMCLAHIKRGLARKPSFFYI
jgi:hypothetical protein